jgi:hypothetical protein
MGTRGTQLLQSQALVFLTFLLRQDLAPASIRALVDEGLCATIPEGSAQGHTLRGMLLHICETTVLQHSLPARLINRDLQEGSDLPHLPGHVGFKLCEMDQTHIR